MLGPASAAAKPITNTSYYWTTTSLNKAEEVGCEQGFLDSFNGADSEVILDFGGQLSDRSGTESTSQTFDFTNTQIENIALSFALSYYLCTESPYNTLTLGIGTNNSKDAVTKLGGEAWANVLNTVATVVLETPEEADQVAIWGADDLEVGYSEGEDAYKWASGYNESSESPYIDFGDAAGCPAGTHNNGACTGGEAGWDQNLEYLLAYGLQDAVAAPEVYYNKPPGSPVNAEQWTEIAQYAIAELGGCLYYQGPLDQDGFDESDNSSQAWNQLHDRLEAMGENYLTAPEYCGAGIGEPPYSLEI